MNIFKKLKNLIIKKEVPSSAKLAEDMSVHERIKRLERNYLILLKRVLEMDGVQLKTKTNSFPTKVLQTPDDKGLDEYKPTLH